MTQKTKRPGRQPEHASTSSAETHPNPSQDDNHGTTTLSIDDLLNRAKASIVAGEDRLHQAAEDTAAAGEQGATQRQIAETVGKSQSWVNGLLKWRSAGYPDTAFGPQSKAKRDQAPNQAKRKPTSTTERAEAVKAKAEAATARARAQQAKAEAAEARAQARKAKAETDQARERWRARPYKKEIHSSNRTLLVKTLGMLGSELDGECLNAARKAEQLRKKLDMSWEELIIEATEQQQAAA